MAVSSTSSTSSTYNIPGLDSVGTSIDWQGMLEEMYQADEQSLTPYNDQISVYNTQMSAWQTFATDLTKLQTASDTMNSPAGIDVFTANVSSSSSTSASSLLSATASSSAAAGTHQVVITNIAQAEELASADFSSQTSALNITGTILVNGHAVKIAATDTLQNLAANINNADSGSTPSGVTATVIQDSPTSWRLELTSDNTGASGISLENGSATDTLGTLGFNGAGTSIKNHVTGGAESDAFSSSSTGVAALLGAASLTGPVYINGIQVTIDTTDSLQTIASDMDTAGIQASVVKAANGTCRLAIANMTSYTDYDNILQSLGLIQGNRPDIVGVTGSAANTSDGSTPITTSTKIANIFGYTYNSGDTITISGTTHNGTTVTATPFTITQTTKVGDLLNAIQSAFDPNSTGSVTAALNSDGQIQVIDNQTGTSQLSVNLTSSISANSGTLSFGSFGQVGTISKRVLQQGADAAFTVDGMSMTSSSNTVTTAIPGVTLNLLGGDSGTTLTLNVTHDVQGVENNINGMVSAYNDVMSFINTQMSYNTQTQQTGGPLFGNTALESIKSQLESSVLAQVGTGTFQYLSQIGITQGGNAQLSFDTTTFENALSTNFNGVADLFTDSAVSSNSLFQYVYDSSTTQSGTYNVTVSQLPGSGQNIAGTIDGYQATGKGNVLSLSNGSSGADGLGIAYTGNTVGDSATITVSRGIASLMVGLVNGFNDPVNGTVTAEEGGLQSNITQLNNQVSNMQSNITMQINNLQTEFINMDETVAQLDSMQSYLSYQLASLSA
ncbi:MAG TPA: flagellar filament capping protein FliD [Syntrophobacteraceae bacterium]|nr:flagellar filament capping protein FliD [Syntrophobacteraceae bacterium]